MFKLLKNNLLNILDETQDERSILKNHILYSSIKTEQHLNTLIIDVSELDFVNNHNDYKQILRIINSHD